MSENHNQSGYNLWSAFYDTYPNVTVACDELHFPKEWRGLIGKNVLEIGCGTGRHTQKLLQLNNQVTGIDLSEGMLEVARNKLHSENLTLLHADFIKHPMTEETFDAAICSLVVEHIADLEAFFYKVSEILRSKGLFYLSEIHPVRTSQGIMAHFKVNDSEEVHLTRYPHTEDSFKSALEKSSLKILEQKTILGSEELSQINPKWEKHLGKPLIQIWTLQKN